MSPSSKMLRCDKCAVTFFDSEGRDPKKPPGKHGRRGCDADLRWVEMPEAPAAVRTID